MANNIKLPQKGLKESEILNYLHEFKKNDIPYREGKVFAYVYMPDPEIEQICKKAYGMYLSENGLDPTAFPSLLKMERDVISITANLLNGDNEVVGNFTSGGTESIILAVKTARDLFRKSHPGVRPCMILAETAHAAFHKAAHYLDVDVCMLDVDHESFKMVPELVENAIDQHTMLIVASAPSYAHGVIDPIESIGALAAKNDILFHVDACVGGMYLPFLRCIGEEVVPFDFSVRGVTSISCDLHKYGYAAKGASIILYKNKHLRSHQIFSCAAWSGYAVVNPTVTSSKTGGPIAGAWSTLHAIGVSGYERMVKMTTDATLKMVNFVDQHPHLSLLGKPDMNLIAFQSLDPSVSVFAISDKMSSRGWHIQVQFASVCSPAAIHLSINYANVSSMEALINDFEWAMQECQLQSNSSEGLTLDAILPMIEYLDVDSFDSMAEMLGIGDAASMGSSMVLINELLNSLSPLQRNKMLTLFMNRAYISE